MRPWLCVAVALWSFLASARPTAHALVIGNNDPPADAEGLRSLRYADDDAVRAFEFFGRFADSTRLLSVLDAQTQRRYPSAPREARPPSLSELRAAVAELSSRIRADVARGDSPVVYLAFSGHGKLEANGSTSLLLIDGPLTREVLYDEVLAKLEPAFVHLFVDACHAESVVGGRGPDRDAPTVAVAAATAQAAFEPQLPARFPRVGALLATTVDQQAHEWSQIESGVFTHELLSALSGAADANADGVVEYSEVRAFVAAANRDLSDPRAVPRLVALPPRLDVHAELVSLSRFRRTAFLRGGFSFGRFHVERENGQRVLDAHFMPDHAATVAVPAGRLFVVTDEQEVELELAEGQTQQLTASRLVPKHTAARGSVAAALGRELFRSPFGATYYKGYVDSLGETSVLFSPPPAASQVMREAPRGGLVALLTSSAVLGVGAAVLTGFAVANLRAYEQTAFQRPALEAHGRMVGFSTGAAVAGALAIAGAVVTALLWQGSDRPLAWLFWPEPTGAAAQNPAAP